MKKVVRFIFMVTLLLLGACSNQESRISNQDSEKTPFKIEEAKATILNSQSVIGATYVETKKGKRVKIVPTALQYVIKVKPASQKKLFNSTKNVMELKIIPNKELKEASKEALDLNIFNSEEHDLGYGSRQGLSEFNSEGVGTLDLTYTLGTDVENKEIPLLPSEEKLNNLKENALKATLVVIRDNKEIGRYDLNSINEIN